MHYDSPQEAHNRLTGCMVLYNGRAAYVTSVTGVEGGEAAALRDLSRRQEIEQDTAVRNLQRAHPDDWRDHWDRWLREAGTRFREEREALRAELRRARGDDDNIQLNLVFYPKKETKTVLLHDPLLNIRTFPLGYLNHKGHSYYLSRTPIRGGGYKQAIQGGNIYIQHPRADGYGVHFDGLYHEPTFNDMVEGKYPTYAYAVENIGKKEAYSIAFKRHLSLERDPELPELYILMYKGRRIGWGDPDRLKLPKEHQYLKETLEEAGVQTR
jgi:hypothetical protein